MKIVACKKLCMLNHGSFRPRKFGAIRYGIIMLFSYYSSDLVRNYVDQELTILGPV